LIEAVRWWILDPFQKPQSHCDGRNGGPKMAKAQLKREVARIPVECGLKAWCAAYSIVMKCEKAEGFCYSTQHYADRPEFLFLQVRTTRSSEAGYTVITLQNTDLLPEHIIKRYIGTRDF
jgi:hypothetical protein